MSALSGMRQKKLLFPILCFLALAVVIVIILSVVLNRKKHPEEAWVTPLNNGFYWNQMLFLYYADPTIHDSVVGTTPEPAKKAHTAIRKVFTDLDNENSRLEAKEDKKEEKGEGDKKKKEKKRTVVDSTVFEAYMNTTHSGFIFPDSPTFSMVEEVLNELSTDIESLGPKLKTSITHKYLCDGEPDEKGQEDIALKGFAMNLVPTAGKDDLKELIDQELKLPDTRDHCKKAKAPEQLKDPKPSVVRYLKLSETFIVHIGDVYPGDKNFVALKALPTDKLDLTQFFEPATPGVKHEYQLVSVINGKQVTKPKKGEKIGQFSTFFLTGDKWYEGEDGNVKQIEKSSVVPKNAVTLMFQKVLPKP